MLEFLQTAAVTIVSFLIVLGVIVTVHELGHFWAAKAMGVAIDRFSIGFGRAIASWKDRSGVEWRVGWVPLGGYVRFSGDENAASVPDSENLEDLRKKVLEREGPAALKRYFHFKPLWQRAIVVAAGPIANFVLAILLFAALAMALGDTKLPPRIAQVMPDTPAQQAGFRAGDTILQADGKTVKTFEDIAAIVQLRGEVPIRFVVERDGHETVLNATPRWKTTKDIFGNDQKIGLLGVVPHQDPSDYVMVRYGPIEALGQGGERTWRTLSTTIYYLGRMIRGQVSADQLQGPLGIAHTTGKLAQMSAEGVDLATSVKQVVVNMTVLAAAISVGVGFMNLLPIPVLDGGHLLFYAYEAVARRPLTAKVQEVGFRVGLALVLGLMLFATWNDLQRLRVFKILGGFLT